MPSDPALHAAPQAPLHDWTVLICTRMVREARHMSEWTSDRGGLPLKSSNCSEMVRFLKANRSYGDARCMIILGPEPDDDLTQVVERCLEFRAEFPDVPIILLLPDVSSNDFSTTRMAICDVTLRSPVTQTAFELGVTYAVINNRTYRERCLPAPVGRVRAVARR